MKWSALRKNVITPVLIQYVGQWMIQSCIKVTKVHYRKSILTRAVLLTIGVQKLNFFSEMFAARIFAFSAQTTLGMVLDDPTDVNQLSKKLTFHFSIFRRQQQPLWCMNTLQGQLSLPAWICLPWSNWRRVVGTKYITYMYIPQAMFYIVHCNLFLTMQSTLNLQALAILSHTHHN